MHQLIKSLVHSTIPVHWSSVYANRIQFWNVVFLQLGDEIPCLMNSPVRWFADTYSAYSVSLLKIWQFKCWCVFVDSVKDFKCTCSLCLHVTWDPHLNLLWTILLPGLHWPNSDWPETMPLLQEWYFQCDDRVRQEAKPKVHELKVYCIRKEQGCRWLALGQLILPN